MILFSFGIAAIVAAIATGVELGSARGKKPVLRSVAGVITLVLTWAVDWLYLYTYTPTFSGAGWLGLLLMNVGIVAVVFGVVNGLIFAGNNYNFDSYRGRENDRIGWAAQLFLIGFILFVAVGLGLINNWPLRGASDVYGHLAQVTIDKNSADYPPTDDNHMVTVALPHALNKASQVMNQSIPGSNVSIGSRYTLNTCDLQSVAGHMYYICSLKLEGTTSSQAVHYIVPGYIVVDAENPVPDAVVKLGYKMQYTDGAAYDHSLTRLVWNKFKTDYIDNLTLEVDDNWRPFYTASLDKPVVRWQQAAPVGFITVDPQTGAIQRYDLQHIPAWVDRVYSADMATMMLNWWGNWGIVPWSQKGPGGRLKVDGNVDLVYTTHGPAWQALMTSYNSDTSVSYVALMDTRSNKVTMYPPAKGQTISTQDTVMNAFNQSQNNLKGLEPASLALHEIYGELVWVAPLIPKGSDPAKAESFQGLGLLTANNASGSQVIIGENKGDALSQLSAQIATGTDNSAPGANSHIGHMQGTVSVADQYVDGSKTYLVLKLSNDPGHIYRAQITGTDPKVLEMALVRQGDSVVITYTDNGGAQVRQISSLTDTTLNPTH